MQVPGIRYQELRWDFPALAGWSWQSVEITGGIADEREVQQRMAVVLEHEVVRDLRRRTAFALGDREHLAGTEALLRGFVER